VCAPSGEQIEIVFGDQRAVVVEVGGGLRAYSAGGLELLDGYSAEGPSTSARGQVLIPWPNRLEDGSYEFDGRRHQLPLTEPSTETAIHGLVHSSPWTVAVRQPARAVLEHVVDPQPGYPFSLALRIEYMLWAGGLIVYTTATNVGTDPCPFGAGAHPYLTLGTATVDSLLLRVPAASVVTCDERGLPVRTEAVEGTVYDFRRPRRIGTTKLDNAFTELERDDGMLAHVELHDPDGGNGVTLWFDESFPYVLVFTGDPLPDVDRRSLAVEPMTCPPNAFRTGTALIRLEPGRSVTTVWGITPSVR